jgi:hypothetical protein
VSDSPEEFGLHDVVYAGLNVYQYLPADKFFEVLTNFLLCLGRFMLSFVSVSCTYAPVYVCMHTDD